jgi:hypothetical protein
LNTIFIQITLEAAAVVQHEIMQSAKTKSDDNQLKDFINRWLETFDGLNEENIRVLRNESSAINEEDDVARQ